MEFERAGDATVRVEQVNQAMATYGFGRDDLYALKNPNVALSATNGCIAAANNS